MEHFGTDIPHTKIILTRCIATCDIGLKKLVLLAFNFTEFYLQALISSLVDDS